MVWESSFTSLNFGFLTSKNIREPAHCSSYLRTVVRIKWDTIKCLVWINAAAVPSLSEPWVQVTHPALCWGSPGLPLFSPPGSFLPQHHSSSPLGSLPRARGRQASFAFPKPSMHLLTTLGMLYCRLPIRLSFWRTEAICGSGWMLVNVCGINAQVLMCLSQSWCESPLQEEYKAVRRLGRGPEHPSVLTEAQPSLAAVSAAKCLCVRCHLFFLTAGPYNPPRKEVQGLSSGGLWMQKRLHPGKVVNTTFIRCPL